MMEKDESDSVRHRAKGIPAGMLDIPTSINIINFFWLTARYVALLTV